MCLSSPHVYETIGKFTYSLTRKEESSRNFSHNNECEKRNDDDDDDPDDDEEEEVFLRPIRSSIGCFCFCCWWWCFEKRERRIVTSSSSHRGERGPESREEIVGWRFGGVEDPKRGVSAICATTTTESFVLEERERGLRRRKVCFLGVFLETFGTFFFPRESGTRDDDDDDDDDWCGDVFRRRRGHSRGFGLVGWVFESGRGGGERRRS